MNDVTEVRTFAGWSLMRLEWLRGGGPCGWGLTCVVGVHLCSPVRREVIGVVQAISGLRFTVVVAMFLLWLDLWRVL